MNSLVEQIQTELTKNSYIRGYKLMVVIDHPAIIIRGKVRRYYEKQIAGETAMRLLKHQFSLRNEIVVLSQDETW